MTTLVSLHTHPFVWFFLEKAGSAGLEQFYERGAPRSTIFCSYRMNLRESTCAEVMPGRFYARESPGCRRVGRFSRMSWCAHQSRQALAFLPKDAPVMASSVAQTRFCVAASSESSSRRFSNSG